MRPLATLSMLLLASCVANAQQGRPGGYYLGMPGDYAVQPRPDFAPAPSGARSTRYTGTGDGSLLAARITPIGGGRTAVELQTQGNGTACAGSFDGVGTMQGNRIVAQDKTTPACRIVFTRTGRKLTADDNDSPACFQLHGAQCGFYGQLTQR